MIFTPFSFFQPTTSISIVTDQLAFYIDPANGNFTDTVGGKTGSENGTVNTVDNNYWSGFSGTDYISYSSVDGINSAISSSFTIESWFYYANTFGASAVKVPFSINSNQGGNEYRFRYLGSDNGNTIQCSVPQTIGADISNASDYRGAWSHNVMVYNYNGGALSSTLLYSAQKVGNNVVTATTTGYILPRIPREMLNAIYVGRSTNDTVNFSDGFVGPVRIYNKALSAAEIEQNYNAEVGRFD